MREYTSFLMRFNAAIIDMLWLGGLTLILCYALLGDDYLRFILTEHINLTTSLGWQIFLLNDVLPLLLVVFFWLRYQATPGKMIADCQIVDANSGQKISFRQALLRYVGYLISAFPLGLGFLWILWDKRKQGWHDKIANTVVIMEDVSTVPLVELQKTAHATR